MKSRKMTEVDKLQFAENDSLLIARLIGTFGIKLGDFGITVITCKPDGDFGVIASGKHEGYFVNIKTRIVSGGYNVSRMNEGRSELHLCPAVVNALLPVFHANALHELTHVIHNRVIPNHSQLFTERAAYFYQFQVYIKYNLPELAEKTRQIAMNILYDGLPAWGKFPMDYDLKMCIGIYNDMKQITDTFKEMIFGAMKNNKINFIN